MNFIIQLKKYRKIKGLTQKQLGNIIGVTQQYVAELERIDRAKSPTLEVILDLCCALKICPCDLVQFNCGGKDFVGECNSCKRKRY